MSQRKLPPYYVSMPWTLYAITTLVMLIAYSTFILLDTNNPHTNYTPRGQTLAWDPLLIGVNVFADTSIFIANTLIASAIFYLLHKRGPKLRYRWAARALALALFFVGSIHLYSTFTIWIPLYHFGAGLKFITAAITTATAIAVIPLAKKRVLLYQYEDNQKDQLQKRTDQLVGQLVAAEQKERTRLAYDLHDGLTQTAVATHQHLQTHSYILTDYLTNPNSTITPHQLHESMDTCLTIAQKTILDSRSLIDDLRPRVLDDFGLPSALEHKCNDLQNQGYNIDFSLTLPPEGYCQRANNEVETALYRIAIEALNNILKHAKATTITVDLELTGVDHHTPNACLTIIDDGIGFDTTVARNPLYTGTGEHIGLASMHERIKMLGGFVSITSTQGTGTTIRAEIPFPPLADVTNNPNHEDGHFYDHPQTPDTEEAQPSPTSKHLSE